MSTLKEANTTCCPPFDPAQWDDKMLEWDNKYFLKQSVFTLFYMPLNFGPVMRKLDKQIKESGVQMVDWLCLSDHTSKWNMDVYLAVDKPLDTSASVTLSGKYYCKVYEGPFKDTEKWCNDYKKLVEAKGYTISKWYMWYTTCPKCAKKYGKNYVAIICRIE